MGAAHGTGTAASRSGKDTAAAAPGHRNTGQISPVGKVKGVEPSRAAHSCGVPVVLLNHHQIPAVRVVQVRLPVAGVPDQVGLPDPSCRFRRLPCRVAIALTECCKCHREKYQPLITEIPLTFRHARQCRATQQVPVARRCRRGGEPPFFFVTGASRALAATGHLVRKTTTTNRIDAR